MICQLSASREETVIPLPNPKWVEALIAPKAAESLSEKKVTAHCSEHMTSLTAPKRVVFTDAMPKTPSGKLLMRECRQRYAGWANGSTIELMV